MSTNLELVLADLITRLPDLAADSRPNQETVLRSLLTPLVGQAATFTAVKKIQPQAGDLLIFMLPEGACGFFARREVAESCAPVIKEAIQQANPGVDKVGVLFLATGLEFLDKSTRDDLRRWLDAQPE